MPDASGNDRELFEAWRDGDRAAGAELVERHLGALGRFFANKVALEFDVHDLVAETFRRCTEDLERYRGHASVRTYLFAIAHNVLREYIRRAKRARERLDFGTVSVADLGPSPSAVFAAGREHKLLLEGLRRLPVDYQVVLELTYFEDLTRAEIAAVTGWAAGTVASRLRKARELLDAALRELASGPDLLRSTTADLERWTRELRARIYRKPD